MTRCFALLTLAGAILASPACSIRKYAIRQIGGALASGGSTFSSDNDPELIRSAVPFSLKLIETLLGQTPRDPNLLLAAASGFTQYAYGFVYLDADMTPDRDTAAALRARAAKLYLRARDYGLRGLEVRHPNFAASLKAGPKQAVQSLAAKDVPLMYWTALSWAGALAASRDMFMLPQIPQFEALLDRALEVDESYDDGALHTFLIAFEMASPTRRGDKAARARQHYERALELSKGHQAGPYVAYAESVLVPAGDRAGFEAALQKALAVNVDAEPSHRLQNLLLQRRAKWLLSRTASLFPAGHQP
jgi:predicted anti-sigma-YlaC factor YlaD